jgi:hypothetical protein
MILEAVRAMRVELVSALRRGETGDGKRGCDRSRRLDKLVERRTDHVSVTRRDLTLVRAPRRPRTVASLRRDEQAETKIALLIVTIHKGVSTTDDLLVWRQLLLLALLLPLCRRRGSRLVLLLFGTRFDVLRIRDGDERRWHSDNRCWA